MMCSTVAAVGGLMLASYSGGVNNVTGGNQTLLFAVGAAVIGGTSLFGGKGRIFDAIIGGTVVATIANGMGLMNQPDSRKYIVTGLVLLVAASVDAISRRRPPPADESDGAVVPPRPASAQRAGAGTCARHPADGAQARPDDAG